VVVTADQAFPVEFDGETLETSTASFAVLKEAIQLCS
jgi:diacylglycerol kinase family enzyme